MKKIFSFLVIAVAMLFASGCSVSGNNTVSNNSVTTSIPSVNQVENSPAPSGSTQSGNIQGSVSSTPVITTSTVPVQSKPVEKAKASVNIQNFAFDPATVTIKKGTIVTWTNQDSAPHQIKSATFNSQLLSQGQSFSFTFSNAGSFDYSCSIHPSMTGKVVVQ
jgi:plastocyanin